MPTTRSEDRWFPSETHSHKNSCATFWLWNVRRSYLFNDIIAFLSLIQLYRGSCLPSPTSRALENVINNFLIPFNIFKPFHGLTFYTAKLRVLRTCRSPVFMVARRAGQWFILVARDVGLAILRALCVCFWFSKRTSSYESFVCESGFICCTACFWISWKNQLIRDLN